MKVLAIVASARKTGNSEILAKEMLKTLPETWEKSLLRLPDLTIEPCKACYACLDAGAACVIQDDLEGFLLQLQQADAVIIAAPVYFLGMHTRLKLICDRLIRVLNDGPGFSGRRCVVAVPYGVEGWQGYGVEATVSFARFLHLDVVGVLPVHAANPGEVVQPETLDKARELALRLLPEALPVGATVPAEWVRQSTRPDDLVCEACGSGVLRLSAEGGVRCAICESQGKLDHLHLSVEWKPSAHFRYSTDGMNEHGQRLESIKNDFISRRQALAELRKPYKD